MPQQFPLGSCDGDSLFKATAIWKDIINHLEGSIKCGRHTQALRSFTNCFHGSKAVDSLVVHLNSKLPKIVERHQVQTLCHKLVLTGVIEDVRNKDKHLFREGRLYRLTKNHFWTDPHKRNFPRTRSCEGIFTSEEVSSGIDVQEDSKGYASDSTVVTQTKSKPATQKKKKRLPLSKEKHQSNVYKSRTSTQCSETKITPVSSNRTRRKSTSSVSKPSDNEPHVLLPFESNKEYLHLETKHRRRIIPTTSHKGGQAFGCRRGSVDSGCRLAYARPPLASHITRLRNRDSSPSKPYGKDKRPRGQKLSHSLKGDRDSGGPRANNTSGAEISKKLQRSHSFSSVSDYAASTEDSCNAKTLASPTTCPRKPSAPTIPSGNKWIVYGFL